jgi:hypothetical protein
MCFRICYSFGSEDWIADVTSTMICGWVGWNVQYRDLGTTNLA